MRKLIFLVPLLALLGMGCESGPKTVPVHPVSGQVIYDGKPAAGVQVFFYPTGGRIPEIPSNPHAVTGSDGRFTLSTYGSDDGAPEGEYQVILLWPPETQEGEEERDEQDRFLGWYDAIHSTLTAQVKAGENQLPLFKLPARKERPVEGSEGVPGRN